MRTAAFPDALKSTIVRLIGKPAETPSAPGRRKATPAVAKIAAREGAPYPREFESVVRLASGAIVRVRPIRPDDEKRLVSLFERLSPRTVYQRFFTTYRRLPSAWYRDFANVDYRTRMALVAEDLDGVRLHGVARWEPTASPDAAEIAVVVEDEWQRRGVGTTLLEHLFAAARRRGITRVHADVLAENEGMLRLLRRLGDVRDTTVEQGVVSLSMVPRVA
jgi:acetyltransferase